MGRTFARILVVIAFSFCGCITLLAQTSGGTIAGTVLDPSGALVANATVTATGTDTGTTYTAVSSSAGTFRFSQMQLGRYDLTFTAAGFSTLKL